MVDGRLDRGGDDCGRDCCYRPLFAIRVSKGLVLYLREANNIKQFDEREREMIQKAFSMSVMVFTLYLMTFSLAAFFLIGGGQDIPVVFMPVMFFTGIFLAQCVQSFILLMRCAKEGDE